MHYEIARLLGVRPHSAASGGSVHVVSVNRMFGVMVLGTLEMYSRGVLGMSIHPLFGVAEDSRGACGRAVLWWLGAQCMLACLGAAMPRLRR